jgi:hypothetical protein
MSGPDIHELSEAFGDAASTSDGLATISTFASWRRSLDALERDIERESIALDLREQRLAAMRDEVEQEKISLDAKRAQLAGELTDFGRALECAKNSAHASRIARHVAEITHPTQEHQHEPPRKN